MSDPSNPTSAKAHWGLYGFVFLSLVVAGILCWHMGTALFDRSEFFHHHVGTPILFRERILGRQRLRAWDWKLNQWIDLGPISGDVDSVATFDGDRAVAYVEGKLLVITELASPEARTTINLDSISRLAWGHLIGIGRNGRYAVLQNTNDRVSPDRSRLIHALRVVDLHSRTLVSEQFGDSFFIAMNGENEFASQRRNVRPPHHLAEPLESMWELSEDGHLQSIATLQSETSLQGDLLIAQVDGVWRVIPSGDARSVATPVHFASIVASRRDGKTSFVVASTGEYYQLDRNTNALTPVESSVLLRITGDGTSVRI